MSHPRDSSDDAGAIGRVRAVLDGQTGIASAGVTFVPEAAIASLRWGGELDAHPPLARVACSRSGFDFVFVPWWERDARRVVRMAAECGTVPFAVVRGPLTAIAEQDGWTPVLRATCGAAPDLASRLDAATGAAIAQAREAAESGVFGVVVAEDVAGETGPLVAPGFVVDDLMPRISRIVSAVHGERRVAVWHSDGDVTRYLRVAAHAGFDGVHPAGLAHGDFEALRAEARPYRLTVFGSIAGSALRAGGPAAVRAGVESAVAAAAGRLLVCDDGGISSGPELAALISAVQAALRARPDPSVPGLDEISETRDSHGSRTASARVDPL